MKSSLFARFLAPPRTWIKISLSCVLKISLGDDGTIVLVLRFHSFPSSISGPLSAYNVAHISNVIIVRGKDIGVAALLEFTVVLLLVGFCKGDNCMVLQHFIEYANLESSQILLSSSSLSAKALDKLTQCNDDDFVLTNECVLTSSDIDPRLHRPHFFFGGSKQQ